MDCDFFESSYYYPQLSPQEEIQVGNPTIVATEDIVHLPPQTTPVLYELPPRSMRSIPLRRYDPEFEKQRSLYPINHGNVDNLSISVVAFNATLRSFYERTIGLLDEYGLGEGCRFKKALYGVKQSPRAWFGRFTTTMKKFGYEKSNSDHTLFLKKEKGRITCLIICVDNMVITGNNEEEISDLKKLFMEFEMKDLGNLKYFLRIKVLRSRRGIFINQKKYILDLLAEIGMLDCKPAEIPIVANLRLQTVQDRELADKEQYQKLAGKLIYLSHNRPNISYAAGVISRFMHLPQVTHMDTVIRILRYLKGTSSRGVFFKKNDHLDLMAYTDADWVGDRDSMKSTLGYFTLVGGNLVTWRSKKQNVVALSRVEAEFRGIAKRITEILWLKKLLCELNFPPKKACKLFCDNQAAINSVQHD
ncbi:uncharacterized mitochondrial protein AtMg00810-like [Amaranthus tricolor]|uniref:uncharacterized mitochondrial protein AtMg00810-like n=1 Tax=Amaranthus tricolor TaxID=29722 RepID=UPI0025905178|nr:uncharacterized mitochondrial protein AtMg00810-like [Amaranthus tricolor]